ncbi:MAG: hypothetical protein PUC65_13525 [Clostridiales bacterium]|nr:hypothetical protein [Clostridiales bacterium]
MKETNCKKKNQGSTLLMVVVAIAFIGMLSSIVLSISMINFQMKTIDLQSKKNFYTAEETMQEIKGSLGELSAKAMEETYAEVLSKYSNLTESGTCISEYFDFRFLTNLKDLLEAGASLGQYNADTIRSHMCKEARTNFVSSNNTMDAQVMASRRDKHMNLKLKDIEIECKDANTGQKTTIKTDIIIYSPGMTFSTTSAYPEFTKYAVVANQQLDSQIGNNTINGDVYAGANGVISVGGTLSIVCNSLITRGNIETQNDAKLTIGDGSKTPDVYAENICTTKKGTNTNPAELTINGNCFVSNDLVLNAPKSNVAISGNYTGFSYNKTNSADDDDKNNADFSSSILVNGKGSSLNLNGLQSLYLAGRSYISNSSGPSAGIPMGQSIGVKSNQTLYLVPEKYLINNAHNPMTAPEFDALPYGVISAVMPKSDIAMIDPTLASFLSDPVATTYRYVVPLSGGSTAELVYFYWNFVDGKAANDFFEYSIRNNEENHSKYEVFKEQMDNYIDPSGSRISINSNIIQKNAGSLFRYDSTNGYVKMSDSVTNPFANPDNPDDTSLQQLNKIANTYVKKQLNLSAVNVTTTDLRLADKTQNPIFESLISYNSTQSLIAEEAAIGSDKGFNDEGSAKVKKFAIDVDGVSGDDAYIVIVDNPGSGSSNIFNISSIQSGANPLGGLATDASKAALRGIIIATGDVQVNTAFDGLIIAGGKVMLGNSQLRADPQLVRQILDYGFRNYYTTPAQYQFLHYFKQYQYGVGSKSGNSGTVDIATNIVYENWTKNAD